jgi:hypothetical protein
MVVMKNAVQSFLFGASFALGWGALVVTPAFAGTLTGASVSGTHLTYGVNGSNETVKVANNATNWQTSLDGLGNVELGGNTTNPNTADFNNAITLTGQVDGFDVVISSLTASDWFGTGNATTSYGNDDLANTWFDAAFAAYGITDVGIAQAVSGVAYQTVFAQTQNPVFAQIAAAQAAAAAPTTASLFDRFLTSGGFERFSDPNVQSVASNADGGLDIVLAGHYDATPQLFSFLNSTELAVVSALAGGPIQASELVKVSYKGSTSYKFGFSATRSGVVDPLDKVSHTGNYTLAQAIPADEPATVPEPSLLLGLAAVGGAIASTKRKSA